MRVARMAKPAHWGRSPACYAACSPAWRSSRTRCSCACDSLALRCFCSCPTRWCKGVYSSRRWRCGLVTSCGVGRRKRRDRFRLPGTCDGSRWHAALAACAASAPTPHLGCKCAVRQLLPLFLHPCPLQRLVPPRLRQCQPLLHRHARRQALPAGRPPCLGLERALAQLRVVLQLLGARALLPQARARVGELGQAAVPCLPQQVCRQGQGVHVVRPVHAMLVCVSRKAALLVDAPPPSAGTLSGAASSSLSCLPGRLALLAALPPVFSADAGTVRWSECGPRGLRAALPVPPLPLRCGCCAHGGGPAACCCERS